MANDKLSIFYQNTRGIRSKCTEFRQGLLRHNYDIVVITESWLHSGILDGEVSDDRYDVFRYDRDLNMSKKKTGGGVMILVHRKFNACRVDISTSTYTELLIISISSKTLNSKTNLHIIGIYIPPDITRLPDSIDNVIKITKMMFQQFSSDNYVVIGDFNLPCVQWDSYGPTHIKQGSTEIQNAGIRLLEQLSLLGLTQYNTLRNSSNNTLDLAFSNLFIEIDTCALPLTKPDRFHPAFAVHLSDHALSFLEESSLPRRNFRKADYLQINDHLQTIDWQLLMKSLTTENAITVFYNIINTVIEEFVPLNRVYKNNKYPKWFSPSLIKIIKEKSKIHKRWKRYGNQLDYDEFVFLRKRQHRIQEACYNNYICRTEQSIQHSPKIFWSYLKSMRRSSNYPQSFSYNDIRYSNGRDICNAFNVFFQSVFGVPTISNATLSSVEKSCDSLSLLNISLDIVDKALSSLDVSKGAGSDNIPPIFWARCAKTLAEPIAFIFNLSLREGLYPDVWKKAHIVPVHKKGSKTAVINYRGISILCTIGKIFEKIVYNAIYPVICKGLPDSQHGFLKKRSTMTNLVCFTDYVLANMERGCQIDVIYTDFEKAFDRVDHVILLQKLQALGIHGDLLRWIKSYLSNRSQAVVLGGFKSDYIKVLTGVPQGSHLGPLFYNVYLYDIVYCFEAAKHLMYADDKKIYLKINTLSDCLALQTDLDTLHQYYEKNKITVNIDKCQIISFTRKKKPITFNYNFNGKNIVRTNVIRDLGILLDDKFILSKHIDSVSEKAFKNLGFVLRECKPFKDVKSLKTVYCAYVRSILEYGSPVWSPNYVKYKTQLERIQRIFVNHLNYRRRLISTSYEQNCYRNNFLTLEQRRMVLDACLLYDIVHAHVDCPELVAGVAYRTPSHRTRHTPVLAVPLRSSNYGSNAPLVRIPHTYNVMFSEIDIFACSKTTFKGHVINFLNEQNNPSNNQC